MLSIACAKTLEEFGIRSEYELPLADFEKFFKAVEQDKEKSRLIDEFADGHVEPATWKGLKD
jgi:hypothetical protein